jgi:phage shock protein PspC (stress-responsive transcriptional regulator)
MFCSACAFPIEAEDFFCRRCGHKTDAGADVEVTVKPKLRRVEDDKRLAGVCGGVARYLHANPKWVRAAWTGASLLPFSPGLIAYGICWAVMPRSGAQKPAVLKQGKKKEKAVPPAKTGQAA